MLSGREKKTCTNSACCTGVRSGCLPLLLRGGLQVVVNERDPSVDDTAD